MAAFFRSRIFFFLAGFLIFALLRLGYGYAIYPNGEPLNTGQYYAQGALSLDFEVSRKNYAGQKKASAGSLMPQALDQRYEKIAVIGLDTDQFDDDEAHVRSVAKSAGALIQQEQAVGLDGARRLQLALGVPPEAFDDVIASLRKIGKQVSFQVNKTDKTNEYRSLLARQASLQKSRDSLVALQQRDADLEALITLETSILALENQIQDLGVSVGEFDSEYEFVTVKLVLSEIAPVRLRDISLPERSKTAVQWALKWYLALSLALLALFGAAYYATRLVKVLKND